MIMIRINDDYLIRINQYEFAVMKDMHRTKKDHGKDFHVYDCMGHYSSLERALQGVIDANRHAVGETLDCDLKDAVAVLSRSETALLEAIKAAFPHKRIKVEEVP